jgi:DNA-binding transcriptional MocR family regulator
MIDSKLPVYMHTVLQPAFARRYRTLMAAVSKHLRPLGVTTPPLDKSGAAGGYYVWVQLPGKVDASVVARVCERDYNLLVHPGSLFIVEGDVSEFQKAMLQGIRLCFAWANEAFLEEGVERLAAVVLALLA